MTISRACSPTSARQMATNWRVAIGSVPTSASSGNEILSRSITACASLRIALAVRQANRRLYLVSERDVLGYREVRKERQVLVNDLHPEALRGGRGQMGMRLCPPE